MSKNIIHTNLAPQAIGPYNQAVQVGNMVFLSGQIAIDPATGDLVLDTIEAETHQVLKNMQAVLNEAGFTLDDVVKCSVFVASMEQYAAINAVYAMYFKSENAPARELVEVANLPKYVHVEISCIAVKA